MYNTCTCTVSMSGKMAYSWFLCVKSMEKGNIQKEKLHGRKIIQKGMVYTYMYTHQTNVSY